MRISYAIVAHQSRLAGARHLARALGGAPIALDDGRFGEGLNHDRAWMMAYQGLNGLPGWCVVLEDDAILGYGFQGQVKDVLANTPEEIVSLYLGTGKPEHVQTDIRSAITQDPHFITHDEVLHAVALAMPGHYAVRMLQYVATREMTVADKRISRWAQLRKHRVAYCWPSIVDHADGDPVITERTDGKPRDMPRNAWALGYRNDWDGSQKINLRGETN